MMNKKSNQKTKDWFIDTSIPRKLFFGHNLFKKEIKKHLNGVRNRENSTVLNAIGGFLEESDIKNDKEKFLIKLKMWIHVAIGFFDGLIKGYADNQSRCPLARASIDESYGKFLEEIDCRTQCEIEKFWKKNKSQLKKLIQEGFKNPHKKNTGFKKSLQLIESTIGDPTALKKKSKCMKVGDFVIVLEMPKHLRMLTFDKAFYSLCGILGSEVIVLPSLATLREQRRQDQHP
ncbi:MAG: hypothetical protein ACC630_00210 [Nitrospinota bacterium]